MADARHLDAARRCQQIHHQLGTVTGNDVAVGAAQDQYRHFEPDRLLPDHLLIDHLLWSQIAGGVSREAKKRRITVEPVPSRHRRDEKMTYPGQSRLFVKCLQIVARLHEPYHRITYGGEAVRRLS